MRTLLLPIVLLAVHPLRLPAQATPGNGRDTITITPSSSAPVRVQITNTGAHATIVGMNDIVADTLTISTPVTMILPREPFALAIVAMPAGAEARVTFAPRSTGTAKLRRFQTTASTPLRIERKADDEPITLNARTIETHRLP